MTSQCSIASRMTQVTNNTDQLTTVTVTSCVNKSGEIDELLLAQIIIP